MAGADDFRRLLGTDLPLHAEIDRIEEFAESHFSGKAPRMGQSAAKTTTTREKLGIHGLSTPSSIG